MTPQRKRAVEIVAEFIRTDRTCKGPMDRRNKIAIDGWERAIVAEGLLEEAITWLQHDHEHGNKQYCEGCRMRDEIRSFLSAEGE